MAEISGYCDVKFESVQRLLSKLVASDEECGASIAVNLDGRDVVDIWAGYKDADRKEHWDRDTICNVFSTTKTVTSLAGLMVIDGGLVRPNTKVVDVWPEFVDKDDIEVRMIMSHTSGLSGWEEDIDVADLFDIGKSTAMLAKQKPFWKPGTASGYHAITHGHLVGEIVKRTTGRDLTQFIEEEISGPLSADFQLGYTEKDSYRVAANITHPSEGMPGSEPGSVAEKSMRAVKALVAAGDAGDPRYLRSQLGAGSGYTNARALTRIFSVVSLGGEKDGVRLLKQETIDLIFQEQAFGQDLVTGVPTRFGLGFGLPGKDTVFDWLPEGRLCFWFGRGGSIVIADVERRLTISYVMNKLGPHGFDISRTKQYVQAVYAVIGIS